MPRGLTIPEILRIKLQRREITQAQHDRALAKLVPGAVSPSPSVTPSSTFALPAGAIPTMIEPPKSAAEIAAEKRAAMTPSELVADYLNGHSDPHPNVPSQKA